MAKSKKCLTNNKIPYSTSPDHLRCVWVLLGRGTRVLKFDLTLFQKDAFVVNISSIKEYLNYEKCLLIPIRTLAKCRKIDTKILVGADLYVKPQIGERQLTQFMFC